MSISPKQFGYLVRLLISKRATSTLSLEKDEHRALRQALLTLISLYDKKRDPAISEFIKFLTTEFTPITKKMVNHKHDFWDNEGLQLAKDEDEIIVSMHKKTIDSLIDDFKNGKLDLTQDQINNIISFSDNELDHYDDWELTCNRYVGFFDFMGFTKLVKQMGNDHGKIYHKMINLREVLNDVEKMKPDESLPSVHNIIKIYQFSDSIVVIAKDDSDISNLFITLTSYKLFFAALRDEMVLRGAIARGQVTADIEKEFFYGDAIIDAVKLESAQKWYGVSFHPTAKMNGGNDKNIPKMDDYHVPLTVEYQVPLKNMNYPNQLTVINWPIVAEKIEDIHNALKPFDGKDSDEKDKISKYHKNTIKFAEEFWNQYRNKSE